MLTGKRTPDKIRALNERLYHEHGINLSSAISVSEKQLLNVMYGKKAPSKRLLSRLSAYLSIPISVLIDDEKELPETLNIDESLSVILKDEEKEDLEMRRHKHYIALNWGMLNLKRRIKLIASTLFIMIPLLLFMAYSILTVSTEKRDKYKEYIEGSDEGYIYNIYIVMSNVFSMIS